MLSLGAIGPVDEEKRRFWIAMWLQDRSVTWLFGWGPLILSEFTKFWGWWAVWMWRYNNLDHVHVTSWVGFAHPKSLLSLGSIGLMKLEIMTFAISVPFPFPIPIPMPRFQYRGLQMAINQLFIARSNWCSLNRFVRSLVCFSYSVEEYRIETKSAIRPMLYSS